MIPSALSRLNCAPVVERPAGAASLHAVAGGGGHVALLVKANDKRLKVDGRQDRFSRSWSSRSCGWPHAAALRASKSRSMISVLSGAST